jgi:hypothetical protein
LGLLEVQVDGSGDAAFEGADSLASGAAPLIVVLARTGQAQLGDGDAVQGGMQLAVAAA